MLKDENTLLFMQQQTDSGLDPEIFLSINGVYVALDSFSGQLNKLSRPASAAIVAGELVNVNNNQVRKANNASVSTIANGLALTSAAIGENCIFLFGPGMVSGLSGLTPNAVYYLGAAGGVTSVKPAAVGTIAQALGYALSATEFIFLLSYQFQQN